jgi:hypothetical protein
MPHKDHDPCHEYGGKPLEIVDGISIEFGVEIALCARQ